MANLSNINNKFLVTTGGNVGINSTGPGEKLEVNGNIQSLDTIYLKNASSGVKWQFYRDGSETLNFRYNNGTAWNSNAISIKNNNNVGIGTTTVNSKLEIYSTATFDPRTSGINIHRPGSFGQYGSIAYNTNETVISSTYTGTGATDYGGIKFQQFNNGTVPRVVMFLNTVGNVGIGTVTPGTKLEIAGNNSARNTLSKILTINGGISAGNPYSGFGMGIYFNGRDYSNEVRDYGYIYSVMETSGLSTPGGDTGFSSQLQFYTNTGGATNTLPTQKMVIKADGTVNITDGNLEISKFTAGGAPYANGEIRFLGQYGRYVGGIQTFSDNASYPDYANGLDFFVQRHVYALPNGHLAMRIDSDGNVGIGTLSPDIGSNAGTAILTLKNTGTNRAVLNMSSTTPGTGPYAQEAFYNGGVLKTLVQHVGDGSTDSGYIKWFTTASGGSTSERMRISSVGDVSIPGGLNIGTTSDVSGTQVAIVSGGVGNLQRWGSTSDGGSQASYRFRIDQSFKFIANNGSGDNLIINSANGTITPNGGIYLGGTGASDLLDDYEEGGWTPVASDFSGNPATIDPTNSTGVYTKIGDLVYWRCTIQMSSKANMISGETFKISGFPFTSSSIPGNWYRASSAIIKQVTFSGFVNFSLVASQSYGYLFDSQTGGAGGTIPVSQLANNTAISITGVYKAN